MGAPPRAPTHTHTCTHSLSLSLSLSLSVKGPVHCIIALFDVPELSILFLQTVVGFSSQSPALTHISHHVV